MPNIVDKKARWLLLGIGLIGCACYHNRASHVQLTKLSPVDSPREFDVRRLDLVVKTVRTLMPKPKGPMVILPDGLKDVSATGRAYLTDGLIFVPSWIAPCGGDGDSSDLWIEGFLYSSKPLQLDRREPFLMLSVPDCCWSSETDENQPIQMCVDVGWRLGHWYKVDNFS